MAAASRRSATRACDSTSTTRPHFSPSTTRPACCARSTTTAPTASSRLTRTDEGRRYFSLDGLRSVVDLTDDAGATVAPYHLDAWGNFRFPTELATSRNRFAFTGHIYDDETGLYNAKARYFDPKLGRFLTQDSFLGQIDEPPSLHRYLYANETQRPSSIRQGTRVAGWPRRGLRGAGPDRRSRATTRPAASRRRRSSLRKTYTRASRREPTRRARRSSRKVQQSVWRGSASSMKPASRTTRTSLLKSRTS